MNESLDDISSLHWRYPLARHRQWSRWWSRLVAECGGDLASARAIDRAKGRALREMQAKHCAGECLAYLTGVVRGRWAGE